MTPITITQKNALAAYQTADENGKKLIKALLGDQLELNQKITDRVKTFKDACDVLGIDPDLGDASELLSYSGSDPIMIGAKALAKLSIISKALNEGWAPDWSNTNEYKYYAWFKYNSGLGLSCNDYASTLSRTRVGSRLCFRTSELAEYAGNQFLDIYNEFLLINK